MYLLLNYKYKNASLRNFLMFSYNMCAYKKAFKKMLKGFYLKCYKLHAVKAVPFNRFWYVIFS